MKIRPELDNMTVKSKIENKENLLGEDIINLLSTIKNSTVLELDGGLGLISEHLSATNSVRLCDDGRLYFAYRRQLFPKSKVIEMNVPPSSINDNYKIVDYVVIHNNDFLDKAKKLAKKAVILTHEMLILENKEITNNEENIADPEVT